MGLTIILGTLVPIALSLVLVFGLLGKFKREQEQTQRLLAMGTPAQGRVLQIAATGQSVTVMGARNLRVMIALEVQLPGHPPYQAQIAPLVSELLIPSIQPGALVNLRVDPQNPLNIAIAGPAQMGMPMAAPGGYPPNPYAPQPGPYGQAYAPQPGFAPMPMQGLSPQLGGQTFQRSGRFVLIMMLVTTVPVLAILSYVFIDFSAYFGGGDSPKGGWCKAATECCKTVFGSDTASCDNYKDGMPVEGCKMAYRGYKDSAKAEGKTCK